MNIVKSNKKQTKVMYIMYLYDVNIFFLVYIHAHVIDSSKDKLVCMCINLW